MFSANNQMVSIVMYIWLLLGGSSRLYRVSFLLDDLIAKEGEDFYTVAAGEAVRGLLSVPLQAICLLNGALRLKNEVIQRNKDAVVLEGCYLTQYIAVLITLLICSWNNWREKASCHRCPQQGICHRVSPRCVCWCTCPVGFPSYFISVLEMHLYLAQSFSTACSACCGLYALTSQKGLRHGLYGFQVKSIYSHYFQLSIVSCFYLPIILSMICGNAVHLNCIFIPVGNVKYIAQKQF